MRLLWELWHPSDYLMNVNYLSNKTIFLWFYFMILSVIDYHVYFKSTIFTQFESRNIYI